MNLAVQKLDANTVAVLSALKVGSSNGDDWVRFRNDALTIKARVKGGWKVVAQKSHNDIVSRIGDDPGGFQTGKLLIGDFDKDGRKEIAVIRDYYFNSGGPPADLRAYRWANGQLKQLGEIQSNQGIEVRRMGSQGHTQFLNSYEIGWEVGHAEMPRWQNVYEIHGGKLLQVNAKFPKLFTRWLPEIRDLLAYHPLDQDLWGHYGYALAYGGIKRKPSQAYMAIYRRAVRNAKKLKREGQSQDATELSKDAEKLRKAAKLGEPFPKAMKPYFFFGDYMSDKQSPRDMPPQCKRLHCDA